MFYDMDNGKVLELPEIDRSIVVASVKEDE